MSLHVFGDGNLFEENMALQCRLKSLKQKLDEYESGKRYLKIQEDYGRMLKGYVRENKRLKNELASAHAETVSVRRIWTDECETIWKEHQSEIAQKNRKIRHLEEKIWDVQYQAEEKITSLTLVYEDKLQEKDCVIEELKKRLAHVEALLDRDSTNTNLPTSQTPIDKVKHIPNSRRSTGKKKGGQPGHEKHMLENPASEEVTDKEDHYLRENEVCPTCGSSEFIYTGKCEDKYEIDVEIHVKKTHHKIWLYECRKCGEIVKSGKAPELWAECQYGPKVQAIALSLMNTTNAAINKVPMLLSGLTNGEIRPSEGYIAKLMKRASKKLGAFMNELYKALLMMPVVYWDDTVVMADKKRICLRFYGDERIAYYVAHEKKDMDSVIEDGVLEVLTPETVVMHDHNSINYNERFSFRNIECNAHLQRDLQRIVDETGHKEPKELKDLISETIKERNDRKEKGEREFEEEYRERFGRKLADILTRMEETAEKNTSAYSGQFERAVVRRLLKHRENYFAWVNDFSIPTTNNLSERALRGAKTKMKVSGQFASARTANNYARIRSYIETCRRNGKNEMVALTKLCEGNPYTVEEILSTT